MQYHFKITKEDVGYSAECVELQGCRTQGDDMKELKENMQDVLDLFLSEPEDSKLIFPKPLVQSRVDRLKGNIMRVPVSPQVALAMRIRQARLAKGMTQSQVAKAMKMNRVYAYQRYEDPETCNPEFLTLAKLKKVLPDLEIEGVFEIEDEIEVDETD